MLNIYIYMKTKVNLLYLFHFNQIYNVIYYLSFLYNNIKNNTSMKSQVSWESQHLDSSCLLIMLFSLSEVCSLNVLHIQL